MGRDFYCLYLHCYQDFEKEERRNSLDQAPITPGQVIVASGKKPNKLWENKKRTSTIWVLSKTSLWIFLSCITFFFIRCSFSYQFLLSHNRFLSLPIMVPPPPTSLSPNHTVTKFWPILDETLWLLYNLQVVWLHIGKQLLNLAKS